MFIQFITPHPGAQLNNSEFLQVQSLQEWRNQVTMASGDESCVKSTSLSVCESAETSSMETTRQLIELLEKARYFDVSVSISLLVHYIFPQCSNVNIVL